MKCLALFAAVLGMAACNHDNECDLHVTDVSDVMPNKHITIKGDFTEAQPLLLIQAGDGSMFSQLPCTASADNMSADCDVSSYPPGTWEIAFGASCFDPDKDMPGAEYGNKREIVIP